MEPKINATVWEDSESYLALQQRVAEIDQLADIVMALTAQVSGVIGQHAASDLLSRVYHLRERLKEVS